MNKDLETGLEVDQRVTVETSKETLDLPGTKYNT